MFKMFRNKKGFSLVELIVVIAILGVISAIAIPAVLNTLNDSKVKADVATAQAISSSIKVAIVNLSTDADPDNDVEAVAGKTYSELADTDGLKAELLKLYPNIAGLETQSSKGDFTITITKVTPTYEGTVSFTDSKDGTHSIDQNNKETYTAKAAS